MVLPDRFSYCQWQKALLKLMILQYKRYWSESSALSLRSSSFAAGEHVFVQLRQSDLPSTGNISHCSRRGDANKSSQSVIGSTVFKFKYTLHGCSLPARTIRWAPQCSNSFQNQRFKDEKNPCPVCV